MKQRKWWFSQGSFSKSLIDFQERISMLNVLGSQCQLQKNKQICSRIRVKKWEATHFENTCSRLVCPVYWIRYWTATSLKPCVQVRIWIVLNKGGVQLIKSFFSIQKRLGFTKKLENIKEGKWWSRDLEHRRKMLEWGNFGQIGFKATLRLCLFIDQWEEAAWGSIQDFKVEVSKSHPEAMQNNCCQWFEKD